jgi:inner membrane protein
MYRKGHVGAALLAYAPIAAVVVAIGFDGVAIGGGAVAVGLASLPDADQRVPFISHRGVTHTVHFAVGIGVLLGLGGGLVGASGGPVPAIALGAFGFVVGTVTLLSHVAADALTPMGVEPFHDGRHYSYDVTRAANPVANYVLLGLGIVAVVVAYAVGVGVAALLGA